MTPERANELAAMCQASADWEPRLGEVASLLESHARMLEAAFPERIADAAGRHNTDGTLPFASAKLRCDDQLMWAHADRGALIAAVRVLTAERDEARGKLAAADTFLAAQGHELAHLQQVELPAAMQERDAARAERADRLAEQLAQMQRDNHREDIGR